MRRRPLWLPTLLILIGLVIGTGRPAICAENDFAELAYKVYYGGLSAIDIDARVSIADGEYELSTNGKSIGFLDFLFPFKSQVTGRGGLRESGAARNFSTVSTFRGRLRKIEGISIVNAVPKWTVAPPIPLDERDPVPEALRIGTLDPVAALVGAATLETASDVCSGTSRIFNGKVRTDVRLEYLGTETLPPNRFSIFSGKADKCEARYETLAGGYKKSWFGSDGPPPVIQFWISRIGDSSFWVPVRVETSTELATVLVHLTTMTTEPTRSIERP
jgi:hypothetical protein